MGTGQVSKHRLGKAGVDHGEATIAIGDEALSDQSPILVPVDDLATHMLAVDHLPQVAASGETTRPDLSVLDSGLLQFACIDRGNSDALPPHADRVAVDHTRRSRPGGGLGRGAPRRSQQNRGGDGQSSSKSQFSTSMEWRAASPNTDRARWSSPAAARSVMARK